MMLSTLHEIAYALYFILPAYTANAAPVIFGGGLAIDTGKRFPDGKPIFGSHKTVRGFGVGLVIGTSTSVFQIALFEFNTLPDFVLPFQFSIALGFVISLGALTGDLIHSFLKRRIGILEGSPLPVADQLDFVLGAMLFSLLISPPPPLITVIIIFVVTPPIHIFTNLIAYSLGVKKNPW